MQFLSREQVRALDHRASAEYGVAGIVLMENAGRGATEVLLRLGVHGPVVVCCGKGNNGGDGLVIARHLANVGATVSVLLFCRPDELAGDAAANYQPVARMGLPVEVCPERARLSAALAAAEWVVDALLGTGLTGPARPPFADAIEAINASPARVFAVDIPSGLDCETGRPLGPTIRARHTVTFAALKLGFADPVAATWLGRVHLVDIGAPATLLDG